MATARRPHATRPTARSSSTPSPTACSGPTSPMLGPVADGGHIVVQHRARLLGADDHAGDPRRPRGLAAGRRRRAPRSATRSRSASATSRSRRWPRRRATTSRWRAASTATRTAPPVCPGCGAEWPRDARRGHRPDGGPLRGLRRRRDAVHVHQRLHDRVRRARAGRRHRRPRERGRAVRPRRRARRRAARQLGPEPDPRVRPARPRRRSRRACGRSSASSARRRPSTMPDSHNAGDFGAFLIGAPHRYAHHAPRSSQRHKTDGHMDIDAVRAGAILVCPVKVAGGGVYLGDMHALQGDGEIAGHTCDVVGHRHAAGRGRQGAGHRRPGAVPGRRGPAVPRPAADRRRARARGGAGARATASTSSRSRCRSRWSAPARTSTRATDNGLARAAELLGMTVPEVRNRATITGAIEIGRHPGVVQVTFRAPRRPAGGARAAGLRARAVRRSG